MQTIILIDTQNVHMGIQSCERTIDRKKFFVYCREKFQGHEIKIFFGYMQKYKHLYEQLKTI